MFSLFIFSPFEPWCRRFFLHFKAFCMKQESDCKGLCTSIHWLIKIAICGTGMSLAGVVMNCVLKVLDVDMIKKKLYLGLLLVGAVVFVTRCVASPLRLRLIRLLRLRIQHRPQQIVSINKPNCKHANYEKINLVPRFNRFGADRPEFVRWAAPGALRACA